MNRLLAGILVVVGAVAGALIYTSSASASIAGFQAGRIMDDSVMADKNSMSVNDIQNFLNSKVPSCDTDGSQNSEMNNAGVPDYNGNGSIQRWEWGKAKYNQTTFPCLKNKTFGGKKAAKLIHEASQAYSISPKVLIVLLQKEQGLITDTWPLNIQYRSATGFGCPDTAPCDSQYYGLKNQLNKAANLFRTVLDGGWTNYPVGNNSIPWNPNIGACGYSNVDVQNRATSALYRYTPYRPNQAALNAGYGTGNGCSSYGNRNFYLYFTDWFGSTRTPLFKINGGGDTVYLMFGDNYYAIPSMEILRAWGLDGQQITNLNSSQLTSYTQGPDLSRIVRFGASAAVYVADNGRLYFIPDWPTINGYGYVSGDTETYSDDNLKNVLSSEGAITKLARINSGAIYYVDTDGKHEFPDYNTFTSTAQSLAGTTQLNNFSTEFVSQIPSSYPILLDGRVVKAKDSATISLHDQGELHWFSADTWKSWGKPLDYGHFDHDGLSEIPASSSPVSITVSDGSNNYLVNNGKRYRFNAPIMSEWGLSVEDFSTGPTFAVSRLGAGPNVGELIRSPSGAVYVVRGGEKVPIASMSDLNSLGYPWGSILNLQNNAIDIVPTSTSVAFGPSSVIRLQNGGIYWIDENFSAYLVPSMDIYNAYKLGSIRQYDNNEVLDTYTVSNLSRVIDNGSGSHYLIDRGKRLAVSTSLYSPSQYDFAEMPQTVLSKMLINSIPSGKALTRFIQGSSATVYKVENGQKRAISSPASLFANGGSWSSITKVSDSFLNTIPTGSTL